jgi:transposase
MSFRELSMMDVREVLRRWQAGQSARRIAREGGVGRNTAARYIEAAKERGVDAQTELTDELVGDVARRVQERPVTEPSARRGQLVAQRARLESWLEDGLTLVRIGELLARDGLVVPYTTLRRFAHDELGWREQAPTVRVDDPPPGDEAQIDFGEACYVADAEARRRKLWVLIVTLSMSRYMFVWPTFTQTLEALCDGLEAAWRFFGGMPRRLVPDNMTTAVVRPHPTDPTINKSFLEYTQARGLFVDPARVRHPQDKPRVENQVPFVRDRLFGGERFSADLVFLRETAATWCRDVAGARVHGTTRRVPREVYELEERPHMQPEPTTAFDVPTWTRAKVHPDHHAQVARALYSLPTRCIGCRLDVRIDRASVRFYAGAELVKMHVRVEPGKRSTDPSDYPVGKADYALRSVDKLVARAHEHGRHVGVYAERLLAGPLPWVRMRQGYALLCLCERYGVERVDALCARALAFDVIDVPRIERMIKRASQIEDEHEARGAVVRLPVGRFARDASTFATLQARSKGGV